MGIVEFIEYLGKLNFSLAVEDGKLNLKGNKRRLSKDEILSIKKNDFVVNYIKEHKEKLIEHLSNSKDSSFENKNKNISSIYRLSGLQEGILFHGLYDETSGAYTEQLFCDLSEPNLDFVIKSWEHLLMHHSILRSGFYYDVFNVPVQCVYHKVDLPVKILDYSDFGKDEQEKALYKLEKEDREKRFDFKSAPLMRVMLIKLNPDRYRMIWTSHHILFDGWSMQILMEEFLRTYEQLHSGEKIKVGKEDRYEDYIRYIERIDKEQQKMYWCKCMEGVEQGTLLPFTAATTNRTKGSGTYETLHLRLDRETTSRLTACAQKNHITVNTIMQGVWSYLLHRYTGNNRILYGVVVSGRPDDLPDVEHRVGMYVNNLPLHSVIENEEKIMDWLKKIQEQQSASRQYQHTPLQDVQSWAGIQGDMFDSILGFENYPVNKVLKSKKWSLQVENVVVLEQTNYPLSVIIGMGSSEQINILLSYNKGILEDVYVKMIRNHFENVVNQIIGNPDSRINDIKLLTPAEENQLFIEFNNTKSEYPSDKTITELFEQQVIKTPDSPAVISGNSKLSYKELNERANQIANYLLSKGVKSEALVAICMERSIDILAGMLGILKAGCAYVPIDPEYPAERIKYMLEDTASEFIITGKRSSQKLKVIENVKLIDLDAEQLTISKLPKDNLKISVKPNNLAYVIYTSGSTGLPKGVMVEHAGIMNLIAWHDKVYEVSDKSRATTMSTIGFDAFGWEIWPYLSVGASITVVDDDTRLSAAGLVSLFNANEITHCFMPTALVPEFLISSRGKIQSLKYLLTGGDKLPGVKIDCEPYKLVNNYGPTENTVVTTYYELSEKDNNIVPPIGKPVFNTVIYILDKNQSPVPVGVEGEIYIGGASLARGYLNHPELTEEKFIPNPFAAKDGYSRLYKTGDIGKWNPDGNIEYIRRADDQVKVRGFRIELGEIETEMNKLEQVRSSCVVVKKDESSSSRLVGYYIPNRKIVKNKERELYARLVANWKELYEEEYSKTETADDIDTEFNIIGWNDSFSGDAIPSEQMREWLNDIAEVILSEKPGKVLEIGSGTGLIFFQLAGKVDKYTGTDFSRSSINQISDRISKGLRDYGLTELKVCAAHEVELKPEEKIDTVVLNSIVQYFPGEDYMTEVLGKSISFLKGKGRVIVGDVRDNRSLELFKSRIQIKRLKESDTIKEFNWAVEQEVLREKELCFSPEYFFKLKSHFPEISHIEILWKQASYSNELSLYRYTVIIYVGDAEVTKPQWESWDEIGDKEEIIERLKKGETVAVKDIPNPRLWQEKLISSGLQNKAIRNVGDLLKASGNESIGTVKVSKLLSEAIEKGYSFKLFLNEDVFKMDVVFEPKKTAKIFEQSYSLKPQSADTIYTNVPLFTDISELIQKDIRKLLQQRLPEYMIPPELISASQMPLTDNGKVDRNFLSQREERVRTGKLKYEAPRNELEEKLTAIWKELLHAEQVGIEDNFFELGGDSIISIQVVSRIRRLGYELKPKDIFIYQTIANLSAVISERSEALKKGEQGLLTGSSGLLPIQQWYFEKTDKDISFFNQSVILSIDKKVTSELFSRVVEIISQQHDALRFKYTRKDGQWIQEYGAETIEGEFIDLSECKEENLAEQIREHAQSVQKSLDIEKGRIARFVLLKTPESQINNRLLIVIHHLAIDGVSWRILLDDIDHLLNQLLEEGKADPGYKSSSYRQWYDALQEYGKSKRLLSQIPYWEEAVANYEPLPVDKNSKETVKLKDTKSHTLRLNKELTQKLLQEVPGAYHTEINDILLCALALTFGESSEGKILIGLEGHGREGISDIIDTTHTVGWFTTLYPVLLQAGKGKELSEAIKSVKEQMRSIPDKGIGYGVLKYISKNEKLRDKDCWDIVFNYLGQLDNVVSKGKLLSAATESRGASAGGEHQAGFKISLNGNVQGGELTLNWTYSNLHFKENTILNYAEKYRSVLESLILHCIEQQKSGAVFTPSDYGLGYELTYKELDRFMHEQINGKSRNEISEGLYRLSGLQQGILFHSLFGGKKGLYINQLSCDLINPDVGNLIKSWNYVLKNHSILRSGFFYDVFSVPVQLVYREVQMPVSVRDLRDIDSDQQKKFIKEYSESDIEKGFDFNFAPLMRVTLFRLNDERYQMLMTYHHLLFDGWSVQILIDEFLSSYLKLISEKELEEKDDDRFEDFIRYIERRDKESEESFWRNYLKGAEKSTLLPFIGATTERTKGIGLYKLSVLQLDKELTSQINNFAQAHRVTLNTILQGVWSYLLHRYTGSDDVIYGVTVSGRPDDLRSIEQRVGMYINTVPSHSSIRENETISEWLQKLQSEEVSSRHYQYTSLQDIQKWIDVQGDYFDNTLTFQNFPMSKLVSARQQSLRVENLYINEQNNFPLSLTILAGDKIDVRFTYNSALLKDEYLTGIQNHFKNVLDQFLTNANAELKDVRLMTEDEECRLLVEYNDTKSDKREFRSAVELFEEQAEKYPDAEALIFKDRKITYKELNELSNKLARYFVKEGASTDRSVFICLENSAEMITGILGILKAGSAYIPVDPGFPDERIKQMLEDSKSSLIITSSNYKSKFKNFTDCRIIELNEVQSEFDNLPAENLNTDIKDNNLAYVIYTSGSTGRPKGVMIEHKSLSNYLLNSKTHYVTESPETSGSFLHLSYSFDASVTGIFMPLISGKSVVISSKQNINVFDDTNFEKYAPYDFIKITPAHLELLKSKMVTQNGKLLTGKLVIGGEALLKNQLGYMIEKGMDIEIINEYGPTEATVGCSTFRFNIKTDSEKLINEIPIGKPIDNVQIYILGENDELMPEGIAGELCIAGECLSRGYLNHPELTSEKFSKNPFSKKEDSKIYRTGDLCRWLPGGILEYAGRKDDQIKVRGYRVELGEIESVLQQCELVKNAAVTAKEDKSGSMRLAAYIVPENIFDKDSIETFISQRLPEYMIPAFWIEMTSLPLTSNGKVDKKTLPEPDVSELKSGVYTEPRSDTESKLASVFAEVLEVDNVGVTDDFFDLGGHSLLAISLISAIRNELGVEIPINDVFDYPTVEQLASRIQVQSDTDVIPAVEVEKSKPELMPLSFSQERLWFIDNLGGSTQYHIPAIIRLKGTLNEDALKNSLQAIVNRHEVLRTVFIEKDGKVYQRILDKNGWRLEIPTGIENRNAIGVEVSHYFHNFISKPFDLSKDHMLRASLLKLNADEHLLAVTLHHIASDGWSLSVIIKELKELYNSFEQGREPDLLPLKIQYSDYSIWQRKYLTGEVLEKKLTYWKNRLEGVAALDLPADFSRPAIQSTRGAALNFKLDKNLSDQLFALSKNYGATLFMTLLAAFKVLLQRYSGQNDICVGTPVAGRQMQETEELIGYFINSVALRSQVDGKVSFNEFLLNLREETINDFAHQDVPFEKVVDEVVKDRSLSRSPLFQVMFMLQNVPESEELLLGNLKLSQETPLHTSSKFDLTFSMTETGEGINGMVEYCTDLYREDTIERMMLHFKNLLESIIKNPQQRIDKLNILDEEERNKVLFEFNDTKTEYPQTGTFVDLIEKAVRENPDAAALIYKDRMLTYKELNELSNKLAHYLKSKGVKSDTLVPICIKRSPEMIVGIIGILKAGGVYVPIEPDYPEERIKFILKDTGAEIVITGKESSSKIPASDEYEILELDSNLSELNKHSIKNLKVKIDPQNLAYVIYTSGSTGQPKGVMTEHGNLMSYLLNNKTAYINNGNAGSGSYIHLSFTFDASITGIFMPLINGKQVVISSEESLEVFEDGNFEKNAPYDFIKITPSHFELLKSKFMTADGKAITRKLVVGGEALLKNQFDFITKSGIDVSIINEYGPTEATVGCSVYEFNAKDAGNNLKNEIPIGRPIDNVCIYILSDAGEPLPKGVTGEIYIGGAGLARGYLNRPDLTGEKFIKDPFSNEANVRLYKTGDLGKWLPDGSIEFLGRKDDQVKIKGYRIELGEIESVLQECKMVRQAAVLVREAGGSKQLTGYIVPEGSFDKETVVKYLKSRLPDYMIPVIWVEMKNFPLTKSGKIDKRALPEPAGSLSNEYIAPRNKTEKVMSEIWKELLRAERVGVNDNFFELGGDSIITIQVLSRARRLGYELKPKDIFIHQTIANLSKVIEERSLSAVTGEQGILTGISGLLPIQQWYFNNSDADISHFNQSSLLSIDKKITPETLNKAAVMLTSFHDALRFRFNFNKENGKWIQEYGTVYGALEIADLKSVNQSDLAEKVNEIADKYQRSLNIEKGEIAKFIFIQTPENEANNRLLIVIHHLAVDGVSWRILLEDLEQILAELQKGTAANLGNKGTSYRQWYDALAKYGTSKRLLSQSDYWYDTAAVNYEPLRVDKEFTGTVRVKDISTETIQIDADQTTQLLHDVPGVYHTEINDILLCALGLTLCEREGRDKIVIGLEGHGRENITDGIDTSRTVGWFTNLFPVLLNTPAGIEMSDAIKSVKEQLRSIPDKGIGYGVLKYINGDEKLGGKDCWDVVFNYLGQIDGVVSSGKILTKAVEQKGADISPEQIAIDKFIINGYVYDGKLSLLWNYSSSHFDQKTVRELAERFKLNLEGLISHCMEQKKYRTVYTPSDYNLTKEITYQELDRFMEEQYRGIPRRESIESIYRLSGLQQGMLFHALYDPGSDAYTEQLRCDLISPDLETVRRSWNHIINRHSILRSSFYYNAFSVPVQCVYKEVDLPVTILDFREMDSTEQAAAVKEFVESDRRKGFDFKNAPLLRIALIRLTEDCYHMLWTSHHILIDGWSLHILMEEFLSCYEQFINGKEPEINPADRYEDYIRYIEREDKEEQEFYWRDYMKEVEQSTLLPFIENTVLRTKGSGFYETVYLKLDREQTTKLERYIQRHHLTANTLMQGVWSYLIHRYTGRDDVVYGVIVSGRPDDILSIEQRVGMYVNTIPLHSVFQKGKGVVKWLQEIQDSQVSSRQYQYTPLQNIQSWTGIQGDLFDSILVFENYPVSEIIQSKQWSLNIKNVILKEQSNFPFTILADNSKLFSLGFYYKPELIPEIYAVEIRDHFRNVLIQIIENDEFILNDIKLPGKEEEERLMIQFNNTETGYPKDKTVIDFIAEHAEKMPDNIALVFEEKELTYRDLNEQSNQLAHYLIKKGVHNEKLVPVLIERSPEMIIAVLGILKAGGAYVPIDPGYPEDRISFMLEDTNSSLIITGKECRDRLSQKNNAGIIDLDEDRILIEEHSKENPGIAVKPDNLVYLIYTSGSTGKPKGVEIEHKGLLNLTLSQKDILGINPEKSVLQFSSYGFDASCYEIFITLVSGGRLVIPKKEDLLSIESIGDLIRKQRIDVAVLPSSFQVLIKDSLKELDTLVSAGEPLNVALAKEIQSNGVKLFNAYGPTENTVCVTISDDPLLPDGTVTIGKPINNVKVYILDNELRCVPVGVPGELCVGGAQVARGYLNRPELTKDKFIRNPYGDNSSERLYRTGDSARWLPDGNIEYLGRIDDQIKIGGHRIELGEIESIMIEHPMIEDAAVVYNDSHGNGKMIAFYKSKKMAVSNPERQDLRNYLGKYLPEYMIPSVFIPIDEIPLTSSGKKDRRKLVKLEVQLTGEDNYTAPRNELEEKLAAIWKDLLNVEQVGVYDNFFELGGNSLSAMRVISVIFRELEIELAIKDLFKFTTINDLSKYLELQLDSYSEEKDSTEYEQLII